MMRFRKGKKSFGDKGFVKKSAICSHASRRTAPPAGCSRRTRARRSDGVRRASCDCGVRGCTTRRWPTACP
eukprot:3693095-Prymnesium_polylepis.3